MEANKKKITDHMQDLGALIALVLLVVGIGIVSPEFRTWSNFLSLLRQSSINGLIAFGMTCVILTDAIDLSVGSVLALSTALCAGMISNGVPAGAAMLAALVIGAGLGAIKRPAGNERQIAGIHCYVDHDDGLPRRDHDFHRREANLEPWG